MEHDKILAEVEKNMEEIEALQSLIKNFDNKENIRNSLLVIKKGI